MGRRRWRVVSRARHPHERRETLGGLHVRLDADRDDLSSGLRLPLEGGKIGMGIGNDSFHDGDVVEPLALGEETSSFGKVLRAVPRLVSRIAIVEVISRRWIAPGED